MFNLGKYHSSNLKKNFTRIQNELEKTRKTREEKILLVIYIFNVHLKHFLQKN